MNQLQLLVKSKPSQGDYGYFVWCYLFLFYYFFLFIFPYRIYHSNRSALPQCGRAELNSPVNFLADRSICHATMALCQRYNFICRYVNICAYICVYICVKYCFRLSGQDLQSVNVGSQLSFSYSGFGWFLFYVALSFQCYALLLYSSFLFEGSTFLCQSKVAVLDAFQSTEVCSAPPHFCDLIAPCTLARRVAKYFVCVCTCLSALCSVKQMCLKLNPHGALLTHLATCLRQLTRLMVRMRLVVKRATTLVIYAFLCVLSTWHYNSHIAVCVVQKRCGNSNRT